MTRMIAPMMAVPTIAWALNLRRTSPAIILARGTSGLRRVLGGCDKEPSVLAYCVGNIFCDWI